jgi:hypothetical protein
MRKRSAARLRRALFVLPVAAVSQQLLANTGVQVPLSQYQAGAEQATQVTNGNFSSRADNDSDGKFETATGWTRVGNLFVDTTVNPPANTSATSPFSAQAQLVNNAQPPSQDFYSYTQPVDRSALTPNANYIVSAYVWNMGRNDGSGFGEGDLISVKVQDSTNTLNNVSATLEGNGSDGQSGATGRLMYIMVNESQMRSWGAIEMAVTADVGTIATPDLPQVWAQWDNVSLTRSDGFAVQKWVGTSGGVFSDSNLWQSGRVPNGPGAVAALIGSASPQTVTNIGARTMGVLRLGGSGSFTLAGDPFDLDVTADGFLNLQGLPEIAVDSGSHTISAPITMKQNGILNVATGANLQVTSDLTTTNVSLTKIGGGTATVTNVRTGSAGLAVDTGTLKVAPNATAAGASKVATVAIGPSARLDLTNNKLITNTAPGTANSSFVYDGLQGQVQRAYNFQQWDQPGLTTSEAAAKTGLTTIGITTGAARGGLGPTDTDVFAGQTITGASTLAMYTYAGDGNLDGVIDGGDYGIIDNNVQIPGASGYYNGDFNYDGVIDGGDYGVIDNNIQAQGAPFPVSGIGIGGVAAVPEPTWLGTGAIALLALRRRLRRA